MNEINEKVKLKDEIIENKIKKEMIQNSNLNNLNINQMELYILR